MQIGRVNRVQIDENLFNDIDEGVESDFLSAFYEIEDSFKKKLGDLMSKSIQEHPVFKGIGGEYAGSVDGADLQAEFGLTDQMAHKATSIIKDKLKEHVNIFLAKIKTGGKFKLEISVDLDDEYKKEFIGEPFEYTSYTPGSGRGHLVKWMGFLLDAANSAIDDYIADIVDYGISYDSVGKGSRSGRATMTKDDTKTQENRRFPYVLNKKFALFHGDDFISDKFESREFSNLVRDILDQLFEKIIDIM